MQAGRKKFSEVRAFEFLRRALAEAAIGDQDAQAAIDNENELRDRADELPECVRLQLRAQSTISRRRDAAERKLECFRDIQTVPFPAGAVPSAMDDCEADQPRSVRMVLEPLCRGYQPLP